MRTFEQQGLGQCIFLHLLQAVPPSRSSCTPPRSPPTAALSPPFTPAACWTETWGEFTSGGLLGLLLTAQSLSWCLTRVFSLPSPTPMYPPTYLEPGIG